MWKRLFKTICCVCLLSATAYGGAAVVTNNVSTITTTIQMNAKSLDSTIFSEYNPGATMVYDNTGGTGVTSGAIRVNSLKGSIVVQIKLATLGSDGMTVHVEGVYGSDGNTTETLRSLATAPQAGASWGDVHEENFTAVTAANYDLIIPIAKAEAEGLKWIRVGVKATGSVSTDSISVWVRQIQEEW